MVRFGSPTIPVRSASAACILPKPFLLKEITKECTWLALKATGSSKPWSHHHAIINKADFMTVTSQQIYSKFLFTIYCHSLQPLHLHSLLFEFPVVSQWKLYWGACACPDLYNNSHFLGIFSAGKFRNRLYFITDKSLVLWSYHHIFSIFRSHLNGFWSVMVYI